MNNKQVYFLMVVKFMNDIPIRNFSRVFLASGRFTFTSGFDLDSIWSRRVKHLSTRLVVVESLNEYK